MNGKVLGLLIVVVAFGLLAVGPAAADGPESSSQLVSSISEQPLDDCAGPGGECLETELTAAPLDDCAGPGGECLETELTVTPFEFSSTGHCESGCL